MQKRRVKDYLRNNLFWVIMVPIACIVTLGFYMFVHSFGNVDEQKVIKKLAHKKPLKKKIEFEQFFVSCFDKKVVIRCKSLKKDGHCTKEFKKTIKRTCFVLGFLGIEPLDKVMIDIRVFDFCNKQMRESTGCAPAFIRLNRRVGGYEASLIYIPKHRMISKEDRNALFVHELTHALASKHGRRTSRIVGEFFAVYSQIKFFGHKYHLVCNGKGWNQPVLRNHKGNYVYPDETAKKLMSVLSSCRYGQLEYLTRLLDKESPFLLDALWHELKTDTDGL